MDDLSKRMNKMEPYGNDYGNYGYGQHRGGQMAPRPAPNADGWSSGENHFSQQQLYQYQQQQQQQQQAMGYGGHEMYQHPPPPVPQMAGAAGAGWNPGASEFVPKSNLSAAAQEFVPRHMPRNTSQWSYQQQQQLYQQQQQQQQQQSYQPPQPQQPPMHQQQQPARHQNGGYNGGGGRGGRGGGAGGHGGHGGGYNPHQQDTVYGPRDALTDAVATLVFMPSKFDRTTMQLAEKINSCTPDLDTLTGLVDILVETCLKEKGFQCLAGKFCDALAASVTVSFDGRTFKDQLMEKYQSVHAEHDQLLSSHANKCRSLLVFATDLYLQMKDLPPAAQEGEGAEPAAAAAAAAERVRSQLLANLLYQLLMSFLTLGKQDERNLKVVADMLKVSGEALESDEKNASSGQCENMERVMEAVQSISVEDRCSGDTKSLYSRLVAIRQAQWKVEDSEKPTTFVIPEAKPTKKGSNAIAIVQPPGEPARNNNKASVAAAAATATTTVTPVAASQDAKNNAINAAASSAQEGELTEEELRFMAEQMGDDASESGGPGGDVGLISDAGSDMPDEVEAAFQQFLDEQIQQQQNGN